MEALLIDLLPEEEDRYDEIEQSYLNDYVSYVQSNEFDDIVKEFENNLDDYMIC